MKKLIVIAIIAIIGGGILLTFSNETYQTYKLLDSMVQENDHVCDADVCDTSYLSIPESYLQTSMTYLVGGITLSAAGIWVLVKKRPSDE